MQNQFIYVNEEAVCAVCEDMAELFDYGFGCLLCIDCLLESLIEELGNEPRWQIAFAVKEYLEQADVGELKEFFGDFFSTPRFLR